MTLDEFEATLRSLPAGEAAQVSYQLFSELFPPGEPDDYARRTALQLAMAHGCYVQNRPHAHDLLFIKK